MSCRQGKGPGATGRGGDEGGTVVNLRQARKRRAREQARAAADENAARHGRPKAAIDLEAARRDRAERLLDGHKRDEE